MGSAYLYANLAYSDYTNDGHYCMRIAGDTFLNDSKFSVYGAYLSADGSKGEISFVSAQDRNKGMKFSGQLKVYAGGEIKIYE